jgi:hypothetical protein
MNQIITYLSFIKQSVFSLATPFGQSDIIIILLCIIFIILIINFYSRKKIIKRINQIPGIELSDKIFADIKKINENLDVLSVYKNYTRQNFNNISKSFEQIKIIKSKKYNPYKEMGVGGNQSFSTAFISAVGDGIIITSLYSRERTRVLLKEVNNFIPEQELTIEEKEVLEAVKQA